MNPVPVNNSQTPSRPVALSYLIVTAVLQLASIAHPTPASAQPPSRLRETEATERPSKLIVQTIDTGLVAQRLEADTTGRFACVFGQPMPELPANAGRRTRSQLNVYGGPTHVAIVDLTRRKVLARHPVDGDVQQALVDAKYLYWKPTSVNAVNRLALASEPDFQQLPLQIAVEQIFFVGDDRLALVGVQSETTGIKVYNRESLTLLPDDPLGRLELRTMRRGYGTAVNYLGDDELHLTPMVIDQRTGTTKCLTDGFYGVPSLGADAPSSTLVNRSFGNSWWRRRYSDQKVQLLGGATLFGSRSRTWCVSTTRPLWASMEASGYNNNASHSFEVREVVFGKKVAEAVLTADESTGFPRQHGMKFSGDKLLAAMLDKLVVLELSGPALKTVSEPLRLLHPKVSVGAWDRPAVFRLEARGGKPPYRFTLVQAIEGVVVNETTGEVRLDIPSIWKRSVENVSSAAQQQFQMLDSTNLRTSHRSQMPEVVFEKHTGITIPKDMWPTAVPLTLTAADSSGQQDQVFVQAIAMAPKQQIEAANAAGQAARTAQHSRMNAERVQRGSAGGGPVEPRVIELERRMRRIEAQLDAILEKLDEKGAGGVGKK